MKISSLIKTESNVISGQGTSKNIKELNYIKGIIKVIFSILNILNQSNIKV